MATRVLTSIKDKGKLIGFRIATNVKGYKGIHHITLDQAADFHRKVEKICNVKLEDGRWIGTECSIDKLPELDKNGNPIKVDGQIHVLHRVIQDGSTVGFQLMDLNGVVEIYDVGTTLKLAKKFGLVNASLVFKRSKDGRRVNPYIKGILHTIPDKEIKVKKEEKPKISEIMRKGVGQVGDKLSRMKELVELLDKAADAYYNQGREIMSNYEYDKLYDELERLEKETGIVLANSVTQKVGYTVQSKLPKVTHPTRMLSLDKTKDVDVLSNSLGGQEGILSWKLDGITIVATYENGELLSAVTRGNGSVGEDVTANYKTFVNVPLRIDYTDRLVIRGEGLISYKTFEEINSKIADEEAKYKNPRNLASGSIRQLDTRVTKSRKVRFVAFTVVEGLNELETYSAKLDKIQSLGFEIVEYKKVDRDTTKVAVDWFSKRVETNPYPTDGLVITIDNIAYGEYLGSTNKFPRNAKAFKWHDEIKETELLYIDWSASRTGAINPVAVFKAVDLEGTTVERASVHNVSIVEELELGIGDKIQVYKANMIIPQIADNLTRSGTVDIPKTCPVCSGLTEIRVSEQAKVLFCTNVDCPAKHLGKLVHFTTRDAMNIEGLSESTLEKLIALGVIRTYKDIYHINDHMDLIIKQEGFGKRSYNKLWTSIEKSREVDLHSFIYGLGIEQMGKSTSKLICQHYDYDLEKIITATEEELLKIDGVGQKTATELLSYFAENADMVRELSKELKFKAAVKIDRNSPISGKVFVVTGSVYNYKNRKDLQTHIESLGGKVASSVSAKTDYLINNDITSTSSKNKKAKELGVPIISEQEFLDMIK